MNINEENLFNELQLNPKLAKVNLNVKENYLEGFKINYKGLLNRNQLELMLGYAKNRHLKDLTIKRSGAGLVIEFIYNNFKLQ